MSFEKVIFWFYLFVCLFFFYKWLNWTMRKSSFKITSSMRGHVVVSNEVADCQGRLLPSLPSNRILLYHPLAPISHIC